MNTSDLVKIFKALSDETRLKLLALLENGELCVCEIVSILKMSQPKVSFHLNILKDAGLVKMRKEGTRIFYSLDDSDLFKRFLILFIVEKIKNEAFVFNFTQKRREVLYGNKKRSSKNVV